jgi:hypothetical protein
MFAAVHPMFRVLKTSLRPSAEGASIKAAFPEMRFSCAAVGALRRRNSMEQRWSLRKSVTFEVQVAYKCHPVIRGRSRNIGLEGLFIETGIVVPPVGCRVEMEFGLPTGGDPQRIHMPAVVVHRGEDGCGVAFHAFNSRVFRLIEQLLYTPDDRFVPSPCRVRKKRSLAATAGWICNA